MIKLFTGVAGWLVLPALAATVELPQGSFAPLPVVSVQEAKGQYLVAQRTDFSCGAAAVATILRYGFGLRTVNEQVVSDGMLMGGDRALIARQGFSLLDIKRYVEGIGLSVQAYKLEFAQLSQLSVPVITITLAGGFPHFVVIKGIDDRGNVHLADPALGNLALPAEQFLAGWQGVTLAILGPGYDLANPLATLLPPPSAEGNYDHFSALNPPAPLEFGFAHAKLL